MAEEVKAKARRAVQLGVLDAFLWLVRIAAIVVIVWGSVASIASGRLSARAWQSLIVNGLSLGAIYSLIALGYTMVYGVLRFINFAHGEVFMAGSMTAFFVLSSFALGGPLEGGAAYLALGVALVAAIGASTVIAVGLERVAYRPLRGAPRLVPFITAIGASFFLQNAFAGLFGAGVKRYPGLPPLRGSLSFGGFSIRRIELVVIIAAVLMMIALYQLVERTRAGRAMRAVSEDQEIARLMGINVDRTIMLVFAVGGAMAGAAGLLSGLMFQSVDFFSGFRPGIKAFTAAVLGGIGNIPGAMIGGLTLGLIEALGPSLVLAGLGVPSTHQLTDAVAFVTLILVLIFRPTGILGERVASERD